MDKIDIGAEEIRGYEPAKLNEVEQDLRKGLCDMRMDIFAAGGANTGDRKKVRRSLARVLTIRNEMAKSAKAKGAKA